MSRVRHLGPALLAAALCPALLGMACGEPASSAPAVGAAALAPIVAPQDADVPAPPSGSRWAEAVENGSFELVADATTDPPKYGAYWFGALVHEAGVAEDRIEEVDDAPAGRRVLRLSAVDAPVIHKIVADERWADATSARLSWRSLDGGRLVVRLRDGRDELVELPLEAEGGAWTRWEEALGARFVEAVGSAPRPRLQLELAALDGSVEIDEVSVRVALPATDVEALSERLRADITRTLELWYLPEAQGGLGLVDPQTGYVRANAYDVMTGEIVQARKQHGLHTIHVLLVDWLALCREQGWVPELERWRPYLHVVARTLMERHFDEFTALPYGRFAGNDAPIREQPVTVGAWIDFLLDAREVVGDPKLREALLDQARATASTLVHLAELHDLDPAKHPNKIKLNKATGGFEGEHRNWFGSLPNKLTSRGEIDPPRRYNTSWAIVSGRRFWYHLLKSPAAILRVHALSPREGDLAVVLRALERFERPWDAQRYDLENDTDDHYGYLMEDGLTVLEAARAAPPSALLPKVVERAERLVRGATEHRLEAAAARADETLWIQAVRLGTSCAGDSPRAFLGLTRLIDYAPSHERVPLYRAAVSELAANDFRGRQLTNGQFTESFFKHWEMVAICFSGTYQGDCRERPWSEWQGDVGDQFGGPPLSSLLAQALAWRVARPYERPEVLSRFLTILDAADRDLRRDFGYMAGLDPEVAKQYALPPRYTEGLSGQTAAGLGTTTALLDTLAILLSED